MKIIQKGVELTKAKLRAPYFPDNCNISSLRKKKQQNFNLSIITVFLITMTCKRPCYILLYLKQKTILFKLIYFFWKGGAAEKDRVLNFLYRTCLLNGLYSNTCMFYSFTKTIHCEYIYQVLFCNMCGWNCLYVLL